MKKRIFLVVLGLVMVIALSMAGCQSSPTSAPAPANTAAKAPAASTAAVPVKAGAIKIRLTNGLPTTHHLSKIADLFKSEVETNSKGAITVEVYSGGVLFQHSDVPRVLPVGGVEMSISEGGHLGGLTPICDAFGNSFVVTTPEEFAKGRDAVISIFDKELNKSNIKVLSYLDYGRGSFAAKNKMINVPDDVKGMKIRGPTTTFLDNIKQWGGVPITLAAEEVYDALGKGSIDGALVGWSTFGSRNYFEVAKNYSGNANNTPWFLLMNLDTWKSLDAANQKIIMDAALKGEQASHPLAEADDQKWIQMIKDHGGTIHMFTAAELEKWKIATKPSYDTWINNCKSKGVGDQAVALLRAVGVPGY